MAGDGAGRSAAGKAGARPTKGKDPRRKARSGGADATVAHDAAPATPAEGRPEGFPAIAPEWLAAVYRHIGIPALYPPQEEALPAVLGGRNLVLSVPTASGKSLVAYTGILHRLLEQGGKALYIVPLRALASEKYEELAELARFVAEAKLGGARPLKVGIATGDLDEADTRLGSYDVVVTTSEKADSLMRHRAAWMQEVSVVVADEVHLIHDAGRGPTLEVVLARIRAARPNAQFIALSATIANAAELARWLDADLVTSEWRPVDLRVGAHLGRAIHFTDNTLREVGNEPDAVGALVADILADTDGGKGGQALVFVNTRKSTEVAAKKLGDVVAPRLDAATVKRLAEIAASISDEEGERTLTGGKLAACLKQGAAFHHAGLSTAQRSAVERSFKQGLLKVIVATPTLAAGVNIPARRVVIRDCYRYEANRGNQPIPVMEVKQMMGRAGRPRYDPWGEAVLIARSPDEKDALWDTYLLGEPEAIHSKLAAEGPLRMHVLSTVASGFADTMQGLEDFLGSTLMAQETESWVLAERLDRVLDFLEEGEFLTRDGDRIEPTRFGRLTSNLYVDPLSALTLRRALATARQRGSLPMRGVLHAVAATPDMTPLYLRRGDDWVEADVAEHTGEYLLPVPEGGEYEYFLAEAKTAHLLADWMDEMTLEAIERRYGLGPGDLHARTQVGEWLLHAMRELARMVHFDAVGDLSRIVTRMHFGAREELLGLLQLQGVGRFRARVLANAGYRSVAALRKATVAQLAALKGIGPVMARRILEEVGAPVGTKSAETDEGGAGRQESGTRQGTAGEGSGKGAAPKRQNEMNPQEDSKAPAQGPGQKRILDFE